MPGRSAGSEVFPIYGAVCPLGEDVLIIAGSHVDHSLALLKTHLPGIRQGRSQEGVRCCHNQSFYKTPFVYGLAATKDSTLWFKKTGFPHILHGGVQKQGGHVARLAAT